MLITHNAEWTTRLAPRTICAKQCFWASVLLPIDYSVKMFGVSGFAEEVRSLNS